MAHRTMASILAGTLLLTSLACSKSPAKVEITPAKCDLLGKDASRDLKASVLDKKGTPIDDAKIEWKSSNDMVVAVDANGRITAKGTGDATISAKAGKVEGTVSVNCKIVTKVELVPPETGLAGISGAKLPLKVLVTDEKRRELQNVTVVFETSDTNIATVDEKGVVTLVGNGDVTVKGAVGKVSGTLKGTVAIQNPAAVKLTRSSLAIKRGETAPLEFAVLDAKGASLTFPPTFTTSDERVATVDAKGLVTGVGPGTAVITITAGSASNNAKVSVR